MYVKRYFAPEILYFISWRMVLWSLLTGTLALLTYQYFDWHWVAIPWLPVSLIGTATAFYVGFKNNQSYDRGWEARKIWGGIVNVSRSFGAMTRSFIRAQDGSDASLIEQEIKVVIYRHIAWLHVLKHAMRTRTIWEHSYKSSERQRRYFARRVNFSDFDTDVKPFLSEEELLWVKGKKNGAAQLLDRQSQHLASLNRRGYISDLRYIELQKLISELYNEQGRSERIKNSPLPRQYSTSSAIFIIIFTWLLPFGMIKEFEKIGEEMIWLLIPFNLIVSWVFSLMEYTGDYSENPFEGLMNDVPIYSIVRNIEIDLRDMLNEQNLPERMKPEYNVLF